MKILRANEKFLILLNLCTNRKMEKFPKNLKQICFSFFILSFYVCNSVITSFLYTYINRNNINEANLALFVFVAGSSVILSVVFITYKKQKVREVLDNLQEIVDKGNTN